MRDIRISFNDLLELSAKVLEKNGFPRSKSAIAARVLVEADARGIHSHGVVRLKRYIFEKNQGFIDPNAEPAILYETPVSLVIDGNKGLGQHVSIFAMQKCIKKAQTSHICFASVRNSNHFGIAGYYSELAQIHDMIGISMTNTYPLVLPTNGLQPMLGTNPIAVCIPSLAAPFNLDMATSVVPRGKIEVYQRSAKSLPKGWALDEYGKPAVNASKVIQNFNNHSNGGLLPLGGDGEMYGGHKGFGLAMLVDLLSAGLSLGQWSRETYTEKAGGVCHFFGAIRIDAFGDPYEIKAHVHQIIDKVCKSTKIDGREKIYFHGEKEMATRALSYRDGIPLPSELLEELRGLC